MFVGSFVAFAAAVGLFGVRQSLAATPPPASLGESDSIVDVFKAQGALDRKVEVPKGRRVPVAVDRVLSKLPAITKGLTLKKDGYLGRRNATSEDGRQKLVFVWFKDSDSMLNWYEKHVEKELLRPFFPSLAGKKPKFYESLVPKKPVMVIATLTPDFKHHNGKDALAVGQASFEVFSSAAPALAMGPTFAPAS